MIQATPASVPPGRRASAARASVVALFPAAVAAGAGLGLAALALMTPPPGPVLLPRPASIAPAAVSGPVTETATLRWAALFGTRPVAPEVLPPPDEPEAPELFVEDTDDGGLVLRGLALPDNPDDAFAIVEDDAGLHVVRIGSLIADRFEVQSIAAEGMAVRDLDTDLVIEVLFPEDSLAPSGIDRDEDAVDASVLDDGSDAEDDDIGGPGDAGAYPALPANRRAGDRGPIDLDLYRREADSRSEFIPGNTGIPSFGISR